MIFQILMKVNHIFSVINCDRYENIVSMIVSMIDTKTSYLSLTEIISSNKGNIPGSIAINIYLKIKEVSVLRQKISII